MGIYNILQNTHWPFLVLNGVRKSMHPTSEVRNKGSLGHEVPQLWVYTIWREEEGTTIGTWRDAPQHIWIIQALQRKNQEVPWQKDPPQRIQTRTRNIALQLKIKVVSKKLKLRWSGPFTIKYVKPYEATEIEDQSKDSNWLVSGQSLKIYLGGEVPQHTIFIKLEDP